MGKKIGVVNCFQICIFVSGFTTEFERTKQLTLLWIAFKFVSLYRVLQLGFGALHFKDCCELLSNLYLCIGFYNFADVVNKVSQLWIAFKFVSLYRVLQQIIQECREAVVVNCFQICIFVSGFTTIISSLIAAKLLWIAFKFVSLYRVLQHQVLHRCDVACCELLSNLYLCIGFYNGSVFRLMLTTVVNCFQICIFVSGFTTRWFHQCHRECCELLSNLYLCIGFYNSYWMDCYTKAVVNCFQICIFVSGFTTQSFWDCSQTGCELLSNLYLCIGFYNESSGSWWRANVVNCFQICIFVSGFTTELYTIAQALQLWIAFKFVSLYRVLQLFAKMYLKRSVVNCFQICIFVSGFTTELPRTLLALPLWIAFKFVSLYRVLQLIISISLIISNIRVVLESQKVVLPQ